MLSRVEKLKKHDSLIRETNKRKDLEKNRVLKIQRNNVRLVKKIFVDLYEKQYIQPDLIPASQTKIKK